MRIPGEMHADNCTCSICRYVPTASEEFNGPEGPTQMQMDRELIELLASAINGFHFQVNQHPAAYAVTEIRIGIEDIKASFPYGEGGSDTASQAHNPTPPLRKAQHHKGVGREGTRSA